MGAEWLEEQTVSQIHSAWISAVNSGNLPRMLTLMTDDALFFNLG